MVSGILIAGLVFALQSTPDTMPPNSWLSVPGTKMRTVAPVHGQFPGTWGVEGPDAVINDWCGGVLDTKRHRLVLWGGGHNGYYGNELYAFDIATLKWARLNDPTLNWANGSDPNPDGTANARHTYNGLAYIAHTDKLFASGGALNSTTGGAGASITWTFDFVTKTWTNRNPSGTRPPTHVGNPCAYDPATKKVWWGEMNWMTQPLYGLYSYDYDSNAWTKHTSDFTVFYEHTMCVDTKRGLLVWVGPNQETGAGEVLACDIRSGTPTVQKWTTTGGNAFIAQSAPGLDYDPVADKYVGWRGGAVYILDPQTKAWTSQNPPGAPPASGGGVIRGVYGRWRYAPSVNAFVVVSDIDENVHFYKMTAGGGTLPPTDSMPPTVTITTPPPPTAASSSPIALGGSASDNVGVTQVTWSNAATGGSGTASGTTSWTADVPLATGANAITIKAYDPSGNAGTATITLDWAGSGGGGGSPRSPDRENDTLCGLLGVEPFLLLSAALLLRRR